MGINFEQLKADWEQQVLAVLDAATLLEDDQASKLNTVFMQLGGKNGVHTEQMGFILAELQYLQRTYPGANW